LWQDQLGSLPPYDVSPDSLFIAYYASAELNCHRSLGWKQPERILDLYVEFKNLTNGLPVLNGKGLLGALAYYGLGAIDGTEKTEMRDLVLRGGPWTEEEKAAILEYCKSDTDSLARLLIKMLRHIDLPRALYRGRYMSAVSAMEYNGVPIDTEILGRLLANWEVVQDRLIHEVDADYGVYDGRSFRQDRFEDWLSRNNMGWPRLDSGKLALDDDTFEEMANTYPQVVNLRKLRQALSELRLNNLQVGKDGFNRTLLSPFGSITGRTQPSNTKYIFGPGSWLRSLIKPKEGWAIAYID
jgi:DNA polymerase I